MFVINSKALNAISSVCGGIFSKIKKLVVVGDAIISKSPGTGRWFFFILDHYTIIMSEMDGNKFYWFYWFLDEYCSCLKRNYGDLITNSILFYVTRYQKLISFVVGNL